MKIDICWLPWNFLPKIGLFLSLACLSYPHTNSISHFHTFSITCHMLMDIFTGVGRLSAATHTAENAWIPTKMDDISFFHPFCGRCCDHHSRRLEDVQDVFQIVESLTVPASDSFTSALPWRTSSAKWKDCCMQNVLKSFPQVHVFKQVLWHFAARSLCCCAGKRKSVLTLPW